MQCYTLSKVIGQHYHLKFRMVILLVYFNKKIKRIRLIKPTSLGLGRKLKEEYRWLSKQTKAQYNKVSEWWVVDEWLAQ